MSAAGKVVTLDALLPRLAPLRAAGRRVALTNGLFDVLHVGHLRYLEAAREQADLLVVGVNSDASARALKGPERPLIGERERAELLAGFACVDWVVIFGERTAEALLRRLRPDVHCKGADYTAESVPEAGVAAELGIRVAIVGGPKVADSRELIRRLRGGKPPR